MEGPMKVHWTVSGQGDIDLDPAEIEGMTSDEIEEWVMDGVHAEIYEQGNYSIELRGDIPKGTDG